MFVHDRIPNFPPWRMRARSNPRERFVVVPTSRDDPGRLYSHDLLFHLSNNSLSFIVPPMNHQPPRALRNPAAKENYDEPQSRADSECAPPPEPDWNSPRIEQNKRRTCAQGRPDPIRAVD